MPALCQPAIARLYLRGGCFLTYTQHDIGIHAPNLFRCFQQRYLTSLCLLVSAFKRYSALLPQTTQGTNDGSSACCSPGHSSGVNDHCTASPVTANRPDQGL